MTGLQTAFYIIGIIYMGVSLLLILGVVAAILVIRNKVVSLEKMIKEKIDLVSSLPAKAAGALELAKKFSNRKKH